MDELFRFVVIRPPSSGSGISIGLEDEGSVLQRSLRGDTKPMERRKRALEFRQSPRAVLASLDQLAQQVRLEALARGFEQIATAQPADERAAVEASWQAAAAGYTVDQLLAERLLLRDTLLSYILAPSASNVGPSLVTIARYLRALHVVELYAQQSTLLSKPGTVGAVMTAPIQLPSVALAESASRPTPVGFADLLVVRQHILRYDRGEIARIENVLSGESRKHTFKHGLTTERERTFETERTEQTEQERTETERSKLSAELERSLKETIAAKAELSLGYGKEPSFFIRANAGFSYERISEESKKFASELAKEITTKAASKVSERVREVERQKVAESFEEVEEQGIDNRGTTHRSGIYQFIDKVYRCRVHNYGKRWLFDFMVPEPAAWLLASPPPASSELDPPDALVQFPDAVDKGRELSPTDDMELVETGGPGPIISNPFYWGALAARYRVTDLEPPPAPVIHVSKAIALKKTGTEPLVHAENVKIPEGYVARHAMTIGNWHGDGSPKADVNIFVGDLSMGFDMANGAGPFYRGLEPTGGADVVATIGDSLPIAISAHSTDAVAFNLVIVCEPSLPTIAAWRQRTYDRIVARYEQLRRDYQDRAAAAGFLVRNEKRFGRNPATNRITESVEIKKAALAVLDGGRMAGVDQIEEAGLGSPQDPTLPAPQVTNADFEESLNRVRFLEQAFEWEHLTYSLYPYFWSRSSEWRNRFELVDDDPQFEAFLRAGAARVVVAVRPGFQNDVFYYLATGLVWSGSDVPVIGDPRYITIADELRAQSDSDAGVPHGTDWELRIPSQLVQLRADDQLPEWEETAVQPPPIARTWQWREKKLP